MRGIMRLKLRYDIAQHGGKRAVHGTTHFCPDHRSPQSVGEQCEGWIADLHRVPIQHKTCITFTRTQVKAWLN